MTIGQDHKSGKGATDENFPVASHLIARKHRGPILAYYRFARSADDAADHPTLPASEKLRRLDALEDTLIGTSDAAPDALPLRTALAEHGLSPRHALDLLVAFRQDVTKNRYASWDELMDYCRFSAAPVGRFVLDVHGEGTATYPASDALCTALQIINHVQDCGKDFKNLNRAYMPLDMLNAEGAGVDMFGAAKSTPQLGRALQAIVAKTDALMPNARLLPSLVASPRLAMETAIIARLAAKLLELLKARDPLSERVHFSKLESLAVAARAGAGQMTSRMFGFRPMCTANTGGLP